MAVRIFALLIPLAITLPQLQTSRPSAAAPQAQAVHAWPASAPEWSYETRRGSDAALTRVVLESPLQDAVRTIGNAPTGAAEPAPTPPAARTAPAQHALPKPVRLASPGKAATAAKASTRLAVRQAKRPPAAGCVPFTHCAPVVVAKVTPVSRKSL